MTSLSVAVLTMIKGGKFRDPDGDESVIVDAEILSDLTKYPENYDYFLVPIPTPRSAGDLARTANPKIVLSAMQLMCEQSLSPEVFEQWMNVRGWLEKTRKDLK